MSHFDKYRYIFVGVSQMDNYEALLKINFQIYANDKGKEIFDSENGIHLGSYLIQDRERFYLWDYARFERNKLLNTTYDKVRFPETTLKKYIHNQQRYTQYLNRVMKRGIRSRF